MQRYLEGILQVAEEMPNVKFLAYTKNNNVIFPDNLPKNLMIRFSMWKKWNNQTSLKHSSWIEDDTRIPKTHFSCPKDCRKCSYCWTGTKDVVFCKH